MIDKPVTFRVTEEDHAMFLLPVDEAGNSSHLHPCFAFPNETGYIKNHAIVWRRELAQKEVDRYNRDVLKLTPGQVECIVASTMFSGAYYPSNYNGSKMGKFFDDLGWPSERKQHA